MQTRHRLFFALAGAPLFVTLPAQAQNAPASTSSVKMTYLDDEAEAGGFDVTANLTTLPVEWSLAEQENGDGYRLYVTDKAMALVARKSGRETILARRAGKVIPGALAVQRRGALWRVVLAKQVLLEAENTTWDEGRIGFRGTVKNARVQPIEEIFFDDDFMRIKEEVAVAAAKDNPKNGIRIADVSKNEALWRSAQGAWATTGLSENPEAQVAQSVNAFVFQTTAAGPNLALAGRAFWNDYSIEAAARPEGASAIGLVVYAQDEKNYLSLRWTKHQSAAQPGEVQLRAMVDGQPRVLAQTVGGFEDTQWYRLKLGITDGVLQAWIDDEAVLSARTHLFGRGQVGVWAETGNKTAVSLQNANAPAPAPVGAASPKSAEMTALFDDVRVRSGRDRHETFDSIIPGRWQTLSGQWQWKNAAIPATPKISQAVMGEDGWTNLRIGAQLKIPATGSAGLVLRQSAEGAYVLRVGGSQSRDGFAGRAQIVKTQGGKNTLLAETKTEKIWDNSDATWDFRIEDGYLRADAKGKRVLDAYDRSLSEGRVGILASGAAQVRDFTVKFPDVRPTWAKVPELYEQEKQAETMGGWSTPQGFWVGAKPISDGAPAPVATPVATDPKAVPSTLWHKGAFWGDGSLRFEVPELKAEQQFAVLLDSPSRTSTGAQIAFKMEKDVLKATVSREGTKTTAKAPATWNGQVKLDGKPGDWGVELLQRGSFLIARVRKDGSEDTTPLLAARLF